MGCNRGIQGAYEMDIYIYILYIYISWSLYIGVRFLPKWDSLRCVDEFLMNVRCPFFSHLFGTPFPAMASLMEKR